MSRKIRLGLAPLPFEIFGLLAQRFDAVFLLRELRGVPLHELLFFGRPFERLHVLAHALLIVADAFHLRRPRVDLRVDRRQRRLCRPRPPRPACRDRLRTTAAASPPPSSARRAPPPRTRRRRER